MGSPVCTCTLETGAVLKDQSLKSTQFLFVIYEFFSYKATTILAQTFIANN